MSESEGRMTEGYAEVVTVRDQIRKVVDLFDAQWGRHYPPDKNTPWSDKTYGQIRADLLALDLETCTREDVDKAAGVEGRGHSWVSVRCEGCKRGDIDRVIVLGSHPYENTHLCEDCVSTALAMLRASRENEKPRQA